MLTSSRFVLLTITLAWLLAPAPVLSDGLWDRQAAPGVTFRMERQESPARNLYGLRIDPRVVRTESALAKRTVYDLGPLNGRDVLSGMVREHAALGGVNGDFFQFGSDPGGDPQNLMVRGGELLSHPQTGPRSFAAGWGPDGLLALAGATWEASYSANDGPARPIRSLNARSDAGEVTLYTDSAGYAYGSAAAVVARLRAGAYRLGPESTVTGIVTEVFPARGRVRIAPGELLLMGSGAGAPEIEALIPNGRVRVQVRVSGFDWSRVGEVMGGGPILLRDGKPVPPASLNSFAETRHPRTALGRTPRGELWLVVADGRQTMSQGATLAEMTEIMRRWGCVDAINLDGGGSSTMNLLGLTLNRPSAGTERPVANGILLYGPAPPHVERSLELRGPAAPLVVGVPSVVTVWQNRMPVPAEQVLFSAQGAGWVNQEGRVHPVQEGLVEVAVLVDGAIARARLKVVTPQEAERSAFRVLPYLQEPSARQMRITWFTLQPGPGELRVMREGRPLVRRSIPERRGELEYSSLEESEREQFPDMFPPAGCYKHSILLTGLKPDTRYEYRVTQGESVHRAAFRTAPLAGGMRPLRIIAFADSETDPEGRITKRDWKAGRQHPESTGRPAGQTQYFVTETEGFKQNLRVIQDRRPDLVLMAGDLVQGGGYQRAWDEFFFHLAGKWGDLMSHTPLIAALGNWECFGARNGGYSPEAVHASRRKFLAYFDGPPNGSPRYRNVYHRVDYGPVTVLTLDSSNGLPDNTDADTNRNIDAALYPGRDLPDINPGSAQWRWCEAQLRDARKKGQVILVQFHHVPYSGGGHSLPLTAPGSSGQAGIPMRVYTPLFVRYGVAAVLCGHNESFERSVAEGVLFYDAGVAGDGLGYSLSKTDPRFENRFGRWVAHHDAPEKWRGRQLLSGGKHYGHLEIEITPMGSGKTRLRFKPVHLFPTTDPAGRITSFERREYEDVVELEHDRRTGRGKLREIPAGD